VLADHFQQVDVAALPQAVANEIKTIEIAIGNENASDAGHALFPGKTRVCSSLWLIH